MPCTNKGIHSKRTRGRLCVKPSHQTACPWLPAWLMMLRFSPFMKESTLLIFCLKRHTGQPILLGVFFLPWTLGLCKSSNEPPQHFNVRK